MSGATRAGAASLETDLSRFKRGAASAAANADRFVRAVVVAEPVLAIGAAAGLGFLIGGGASRARLQDLARVGGRMVGAWLVKEFLERSPTQE